MERLSERLQGLIGATIAGFIGGWLCGFLILTFGNAIGRGGSSGTEYVGYWDLQSTFWMAFMYGAPLGAIVFDICYVRFLKNVSVKTAVIASFGGTLSGGFLGALSSPAVAAFAGVLGFIVAGAVAADSPASD